MTALTPRAVAVQGIGFSALVLALQGLWPASPYRRAPKGGGYPSRGAQGQRPTQAAMARISQTMGDRPSLPSASRPSFTATRRTPR